jgi:hypothetical protein
MGNKDTYTVNEKHWNIKSKHTEISNPVINTTLSKKEGFNRDLVYSERNSVKMSYHPSYTMAGLCELK